MQNDEITLLQQTSNKEAKMRIAVVGAGGVGGYFGGRLAAEGTDVTFVARGAHFDAMRQKGLRINSATGDVTIEKVKVVDDIGKVGPVDLVIVAVKLWDTEQVAATLKPFVEQGATIVSFQNGVHKDEVLSKYIPATSLIGGVCYIAAVIGEPGIISHHGTMQRLVFGEYDGTRTARAQSLLQECLVAGINADISNEIERLIWEKYVFLVGFSGATSVIRQTIGLIRENTSTRTFLLDLMREVVAVGRAKGVPLREDYAEDRLAFCDTLPASMTSSMHHDLERGNRLELPWLSGGITEFGKQLGVSTPMNRAVADILSLYVSGKA
jgi:2-dehydropantoate 2-reductase